MKTDNELIAEFMGSIHNPDYDLPNSGKHYLGTGMLGGYSANFRYHSSWDWLMPVVEKISNIYCEEEENIWSKEEESKFKSVIGITLCAASTPDSDNESEGIEFVHAKIVEFIKWYNQQKP